MLQYQAGYVLGSLKELFSSVERNSEQYSQLTGLLNNLSTFDVYGPDGNLAGGVYPVLAVANNIITRGLPTLASEQIV